MPEQSLLTWFSPDERLPEPGHEVLAVVSLMHIATSQVTVLRYVWSTNLPAWVFAEDHQEVDPQRIRYWAYIPAKIGHYPTAHRRGQTNHK